MSAEFPPKPIDIPEALLSQWAQFPAAQRVLELRTDLSDRELRAGVVGALALQLVSERAATAHVLPRGNWVSNTVDYSDPREFSLAVGEQASQVQDQLDVFMESFLNSDESLEHVAVLEKGLYLWQAHQQIAFQGYAGDARARSEEVRG